MNSTEDSVGDTLQESTIFGSAQVRFLDWCATVSADILVERGSYVLRHLMGATSTVTMKPVIARLKPKRSKAFEDLLK